MKKEPSKEEYQQIVKNLTPKHNSLLNCTKAFVTGGTFCVLGEVMKQLMMKYLNLSKKDSLLYVTIELILLSVLLTGFNFYGKVTKFGGAGGLVPITGFANSVASAAIEYQKEGQVFGIGVKIFTIAGPVILYGIFSSFVVGLIYLFTKQWGVVSMTSICGMQSLKFENAPYLKGWASVAGKKEGEGPLGNLIDQIIEDPYFGQESWELAEGRFMKQAAMLAISKADLHKKDIRYAFAGDLLEQNTATFSGMKELEIPLFGLFGACSTVGEAMSLAAMSVAGGFAKHSLAIASSHIGSAEKQFRFPLEYGNQRPLSATWTVTGSGGFIVSKEIGPVKIQGITTGKIVDYGMEDPMNMGACMAPAAAEVLYQHFVDFGSKPEDYDAVYTGDLGEVGKKILLHLLRENGYDLSKVHGDCGIEIYENETQDTHSGGSGCACSAVVLASMIIPKIIDGTWKKVLFVPTGALMSKTSFNEGENVAGIAHAILLEGVR